MFRNAPAQVQIAIALLWASFALETIDLVVNWEPLDPAAGEFGVIMLAILIGSVLLTAALIYLVSRRHNWARILLVVFSGTGIATYAVWPPDLSIESAWSIVVSVGITILDIIALYLLFSGTGAKWYSSPKMV